MNRRAFGWVSLSCWMAVGCASVDDRQTCASHGCGVDEVPIEPEIGGTVVASQVDAWVPQCAQGMSEPCSCTGGQVGVRRCTAGVYGECAGCERAEPPLASACAAGRYEGSFFMPSYFPGAASACGLVALYGGTDVVGTLAFTLGATGADDQEFVSVVAAESCLEVHLRSGDSEDGFDSDAGAPPEPVKVSLSGRLNCNTGEFSGELRGAYHSASLCNLGLAEDWYFMKGRLTGTFNRQTRTMEAGQLDMQETPLLVDALSGTSSSGGVGTWSATLDPEAELPESVDDCLDGAPYMDFEMLPR